jgi:hypothetical protein
MKVYCPSFNFEILGKSMIFSLGIKKIYTDIFGELSKIRIMDYLTNVFRLQEYNTGT